MLVVFFPRLSLRFLMNAINAASIVTETTDYVCLKPTPSTSVSLLNLYLPL